MWDGAIVLLTAVPGESIARTGSERAAEVLIGVLMVELLHWVADAPRRRRGEGKRETDCARGHAMRIPSESAPRSRTSRARESARPWATRLPAWPASRGRPSTGHHRHVISRLIGPVWQPFAAWIHSPRRAGRLKLGNPRV